MVNRRHHFSTSSPWLVSSAASLLLLLGTAGCGGGGTDAATAAASTFSVQSISITPADGNYQLNWPITVRFNRPVDFSTVTPNTFNVAVSPGQTIENPDAPGQFLAVGGLPAIGEYMLLDDRTVVFQAACPTLDDLSNSGFLRGVEYTLNIPGQTTDGISIGAAGDGRGLGSSFTVTFTTSNSEDLAGLFLDTVVDPPAAVIRTTGSTTQAATRLEVGGNSLAPVYLERALFAGTGTPPMGFLAPLNLYSNPSTRVDVILVINQPVNPSTLNINNRRIRLEYLLSTGPDVWRDFPSDVILERNCTTVGAEIRIIPLGAFPQDRPMRIVIAPEFEDLIGQRNQGALNDFARFETDVFLNPGTMVPGDGADEIFEPFSIGGTAQGSREDFAASFEVPTADWNKNGSGRLTSAFDFQGTGGPNGTFDLIIPGGQDSDFNSASQAFLGGPNGLPNTTQVAINGVLNVRNLTIADGANWRVRGDRPVTILASGNVTINGRMSANGSNAAPIFTLNTPNLPQTGASGVGGGGKGGTGSPLTTQSTPRGGAGTGGISFVASGGGGGGESGIATVEINFGENRRAGGGGGGVLGSDTLLSTGCPNEDYIGLNAETGHLGATTGMGAVTGVSPPQGGVTGPGPFSDSSAINNFWGTMLIDPGGPAQQTVKGELTRPWAGAGGGAGGDGTTYTASVGYPDPNFPFSREDKGCGGGGGAGSITILALGSITFGPNGRIEARGGSGAGGENTNFTNRVGGGSGGGSGGHIILQSAAMIDFSAVPVATGVCAFPVGTAFNCLSLVALGGQGGAGSGNGGGFDPDNPSSGNPTVDAKPASNGFNDVACSALPRVCAGGDGGPGIIQLHTPRLIDILPPGGASGNLRGIVRPSPLGLNNQTGFWDALLLPAFGDASRARSKWLPLGAMRVAPGTSVPEAIQYIFRGTDPVTGFVNTTAEVVDSLPPILSGALGAPGVFPYVAPGGMTVVFDVTTLAGMDDLYRRNPNLLQLFELDMDNGTTVTTFEVVSATIDELAGELRVTVGALNSGVTPANFSPGHMVDLVPRFFGVSTAGIKDFLPDSARITIQFQAAPLSPLGGPDLVNASPLTTDIADLTNSPSNTDFQFFRFVIDFEITADGSDLSFSTPLPSLDFLRIPFRF